MRLAAVVVTLMWRPLFFLKSYCLSWCCLPGAQGVISWAATVLELSAECQYQAGNLLNFQSDSMYYDILVK